MSILAACVLGRRRWDVQGLSPMRVSHYRSKNASVNGIYTILSSSVRTLYNLHQDKWKSMRGFPAWKRSFAMYPGKILRFAQDDKTETAGKRLRLFSGQMGKRRKIPCSAQEDKTETRGRPFASFRRTSGDCTFLKRCFLPPAQKKNRFLSETVPFFASITCRRSSGPAGP